MSKQYGFLINIAKCVQCDSCVTACKNVHHVELGIKWRKVVNYWDGQYPTPVNFAFSTACQHCDKPSCVEVCPVNCITKRKEDGIVVVDHNACISCYACLDACPYGAPQFGEDGKMQKCGFCLHSRLEKGLSPTCIATCPTKALVFGTTDELAKTPGAQKLDGPLKPNLFVIPPKKGWNKNSFKKAVASIKETTVEASR